MGIQKMINWEKNWASPGREERGGKASTMKFPKAGTLAKLIIPIVLLYALFMTAEALVRRTEAEDYLEQLQQQAESIRRENERLRRETRAADSDEVIAAVARERFGLVLPDEKVFYDPTP